MNSSSHFFKDKPLLGLDIGSSSIKVMQLDGHGKQPIVKGYGAGNYNPGTIKDGVVDDYKGLASTIKDIFTNNIIGEINTRRVALAIPASRTFTRSINLPAELKNNELLQAVRMEAEQYIPMPIDDLYLDYSVIERTDKGIELLAVAVPKKIVDSYMYLVRMLGLEPVAFDTTILAAARLHRQQVNVHDDVPTVLIDFGGYSADITIHDKTVIVTGTMEGGGNSFTDKISKKLGITNEEAHIVKTKYGLSKSKKQSEITDALQPDLTKLIKEIQRMIRYYEERSCSNRKIQQIVMIGGGANMPGLSGFLTDTLRMPARTCNPWQHLTLGRLQPPSVTEKSMYVTVAGLALTQPKELFR